MHTFGAAIYDYEVARKLPAVTIMYLRQDRELQVARTHTLDRVPSLLETSVQPR